uniref:Ycf15 n=1 Tax=Fagus longipetiolata TaxID=167764 RepID=UPI001EDD1254|nr:Ycf15 [Fagus longipetiolata]YP_010261571.1 Ycf15 [Fagus longipetiolata]UIB40609.1 Ycf15 [Fagus longipetiolata]UIB40610.1 Ycf15 [Fagus longipetiolata]
METPLSSIFWTLAPWNNILTTAETRKNIFTTKKYWILFRIGPERRRKSGMPTGASY